MLDLVDHLVSVAKAKGQLGEPHNPLPLALEVPIWAQQILSVASAPNLQDKALATWVWEDLVWEWVGLVWEWVGLVWEWEDRLWEWVGQVWEVLEAWEVLVSLLFPLWAQVEDLACLLKEMRHLGDPLLPLLSIA
jgi:hypothetical protein